MTSTSPVSAQRRLGIAAAAAAIIAAAGLLAALLVPRSSFEVPVAQLGHAGGHAYVARVPVTDNWLYHLVADRPEMPTGSRLTVSEDGRPLGPPHSLHADIGARGGGAYSHWGSALYFSASDNSDPRVNGRRYVAQAVLQLRPIWVAIGTAAAGLALMLQLLAHRRRLAACIRGLPSLGHRLFGWTVGRGAGAGMVVGALAALAAAVAVARAPEFTFDLDRQAIRGDGGAAFALALPQPRSALYRVAGDMPSDPRRSDLVLTEDGRALGPAHAQHEDIRKLGGGRYSHWNTILLFSASDGSDPRSNGRSYRASVHAELRPAWRAAGWGGFALALGCAVLSGLRRPDSRRGRAVAGALDGLRALVTPASCAAPALRLVLLAMTIAGAAAVFVGWHAGQGTTSATELARHFPISDASGYHGCATALAAKGTMAGFDNDWCVRRVLYVGFLATLLPLSAWSSQIALIAQGVIAALAIGLLAVQARAIAGTLAAVVTVLLLAGFAWEFVFGLFMTEALGFPLALMALALLLAGGADRRWRLAGAVLLSAALTARAGAMFLLPALLLWLVWRDWQQPWRRRVVAAALGALAVAAGPLLHFLIVRALGIDASNAGGNYAASLYALSIGSRDWADAYRDFKPLFAQGEKAAFEQIYRIAFDNIAARPEVFVATLWQAMLTYGRTLYVFLPTSLPGWIAPMLSGLALVGLLQALRCARKPWAALLLLLAGAEVASAPFIVDSGGVRVFAASVALRVLLSAIGLCTVVALLLRALPGSAPDAEKAGAAAAPAVALGCSMLAVAALAATPLPRLAAVDTVAAPACPPGQQAVTARVGRESVSLTVLADGDGLRALSPFTVGADRLHGDAPLMEGAYGPDVIRLPRPVTLLRALDLQPEAARAIRTLAIEGPLPAGDGPFGFCVDPSSALSVANVEFARVRSMQAIGAR